MQEVSPELFLYCSAGDTQKAELIIISGADVDQVEEVNEIQIDSSADTGILYIFSCIVRRNNCNDPPDMHLGRLERPNILYAGRKE